MPLSNEDRAHLFEEEAARLAIRRELDPPKPERGFWRAMAAPENVRWIVASLMIPLATGVWGYFDNLSHKDERQKQAELAEARRDVDQLTALIPSLVSERPAERTIGLTVLGNLANASGAGPGIKAAYAQVQATLAAGQRSGDPEQRREAAMDAESLIQGAASAGPGPSAAVTSTAVDGAAPPSASAPAPAAAARPPAPPPSPGAAVTATAPPAKSAPGPRAVGGGRPRYVYIQLYSEADRGKAEALRDALREAGVPVPGIENVVATQGPRMLVTAQLRTADVRYYRDEDRDGALRVSGELQHAAPEVGAPTVRIIRSLSGKVRPGLVEVWFPCARTAAECRSMAP